MATATHAAEDGRSTGRLRLATRSAAWGGERWRIVYRSVWPNRFFWSCWNMRLMLAPYMYTYYADIVSVLAWFSALAGSCDGPATAKAGAPGRAPATEFAPTQPNCQSDGQSSITAQNNL